MLLPIRDHNPSQRFPFVTVGLIVVNVLVFIMQQLDPRVTYLYAAIPYEITGADLSPVDRFWQLQTGARSEPVVNPWLTILTSMFLHGNFWHILGNMWSLWIFGNNVEDALGHVRYLLLYLIWGVAAALSHVVFNWASPVPVVGASGAIAGIMGAYLLLFPHARIDCVLWFFIITFVEVPAIFFLIFWFVSQFVVYNPGVAYIAHIGGFVAGFITIKLLGGSERILYGRRRYYYDDY
ncbi:MAG: rhomboid family intramembrane serine protease [Fimbriimonadales bacterium]|nr:rhomboid family intramembrane serine protease [Fimbriimonadales bacterium]